GPAEAIIGAVPPQHMYGLETTILLPLVTGALVHCGRPLLPADIDEALNAVGAVSGNAARRWLIATPFTLRAMADDPLFAPHLDAIISATMPLEVMLANEIEQRWATALYEIYGCTEGGSLATRRVTESARWHMLPGVTIAMRDDTAWVENGHLTEPVPLADQIVVHTPDTFDLFGRSANLVKVGGKRTSLEALNAALTGLPGVRDGVFFVPDLDRDERLTAFVVAPGLSSRDILAGLRAHIDPAFLPRPIVMVQNLPRNELGKIPRAALESMAAKRGRQ
ncbi:MAG: AMP-binding protein, partial [Burkholderiales bacterium]